MLSWPDALCERLAAGGRRVVRYDLRDSGESTTADPEAPAYTLRDLAADAAALADALGGGPAHLAGIGVGGMVAQVAALDHPGAFSALTLAGTRSVAPGKPDADLVPYARDSDRLVIAYSPLGMGLLSGRYTSTNPPTGSARLNNPLFLPESLDRAQPLIDAVRAVGQPGDGAGFVVDRWEEHAARTVCSRI